MLRHKLALIEKNRHNSAALPSGVAPVTCSSLFKSQDESFKPKAKRWDHHLSVESRARGASTLKASATSIGPPNTITLGTARPAPQYFPWERIDFHGVNSSNPGNGSAIPPASLMSCAKGKGGYDLAVALNYGYAAGSPQLLRFVTEHVELIHNPPYDDWETCLTCGTTSAIDIVFRMLCDRGNWVLTEAYTYPSAIEAIKPLGLNILSVNMDDNGLMPEDLDSRLRSWEADEGPKPRVLYTIPSGHNSTATTQTLERRKAIYQVAELHDLLIIEDDPYFYLPLEGIAWEGTMKEPSTKYEGYLNRLPTSYLSLDRSGRVLRLDTASKILAPGLRCGWITACSQLVQKFLNHTEASTGSPSGPSQLMLYKLLAESWGHDGFIDWLGNLSLQYQRKRNILIESCQRHLPLDICRWNIPTVGMFLWIRFDWAKHPAFRSGQGLGKVQLSLRDIEERIHATAKENGVVVSKGSWFATAQGGQPDLCFRLTFAAASENSFDVAIERFADSVRREFTLL